MLFDSSIGTMWFTCAFSRKKVWTCEREWMLFAVCGQTRPTPRLVCPILSHFYLPIMFFERHVASFVMYYSVEELCVYFLIK